MDADKKLKILFVDDEESILKVSCEYFRRKGYETLTARNGSDALKILEDERVDCCFTDIRMPVMSGVQLAEAIRSLDSLMPVIVMTGYPSIEDAIQTIKNGVVDFLIKPVNLKEMELCVQRVFRQRQLFAENLLLREEVEGKARLETLNRELLGKVDELNILNKILANFTSFSSSSDVFKRAVDLSLEITSADETGFYVINETVREPFQVAGAAIEAHSDRQGGDTGNVLQAFSMKDGPFGKVSEMRRLILEVAADEIPLLMSRNNGSRGLPQCLRSLMLVPLKIRDKVFGVLSASVLDSPVLFAEKDLYYLSVITQSAAQAIENLALYENIYQNLFSTLYAFVKAIEARDLYTRQHSSRVTGISLIMGQEVGCSSEELDILNFAGHLHDIGKIGIRDDILLKPGRLTPEEFEKIKEHPVIGANMLEQLGFWEQERLIIRCHHERFDGTGYPDGLRGQDIPFLARILSVADVYDAMASDRAYRKRMEEDLILKIIREGSGSQFDPDVVQAFDRAYTTGHILDYLKTSDVS
jgi:putative nucleotidyltransferase with HDIG domain